MSSESNPVDEMQAVCAHLNISGFSSSNNSGQLKASLGSCPNSFNEHLNRPIGSVIVGDRANTIKSASGNGNSSYYSQGLLVPAVDLVNSGPPKLLQRRTTSDSNSAQQDEMPANLSSFLKN